MPRRSKIDRLDAETRAWIEQELIGRAFSGYEALASRLAERGLKIGKSLLHRHGRRLERRIAAIRASTEAARRIAEAAPDEEDALSASVISMIQSDTFSVLLALQEAEDAEPAQRLKLLNQASRAIAELSRASIAQKRWAGEVRARLDAAKAAAVDRVDRELANAGLTGAGAERIKAAIMGIRVEA